MLDNKRVQKRKIVTKTNAKFIFFPTYFSKEKRRLNKGIQIVLNNDVIMKVMTSSHKYL